jgi:hypothetical protein
VKALRLATSPLVLVLCASCSSSLDNGPPSRDETVFRPSSGKLKFPNQDIEAKYRAAKKSPDNVEAVTDYGRSVVLFGLASLLDTTCGACQGELAVYRPRSELTTSFWPVIEDALPMLDPFLEAQKQDGSQMDLLVEVKGRLLWLAGRSAEEQSLIDGYALAHPTAMAIVKRRLEILRQASDSYLSESQCNRSRTRMRSAPEAERLDLLSACVALHPNNPEGKSDTPEFATFLPNLSPDEAALYRTHLVQRCEEKAGDEERCAESCACEAKAAGKAPPAKCKRACETCHKQASQEVLACKKLGEVAPEPAPAPRGRTKGKRAAASP